MTTSSALAPPARSCVLELRQVTARHPGRDALALNGVSFRADGRKIGLVGPNGSGKSTLLHVCMGLLPVLTGEALLDGVVVTGEGWRTLRRRVGFVFQQAEDQLFSPTVLEDVAFGPLNLGLPPAEARRVALETLRRLGLEGFEDRPCHRLSGGEKRLAALAGVLAMGPELLLLDEPTNDLDPVMRRRLVGILNDLPTGMVVVSHDWDFLSRTVEACFAMHDGRMEPVDMAVLHSHRHEHEGDDPSLPHRHPTRSSPCPGPDQG